jgi:hypothetical protein
MSAMRTLADATLAFFWLWQPSHFSTSQAPTLFLFFQPTMKTTIQKLIVCFLLLPGTAFSYTISGKTYLTDGSQADVQNACSAAPDNGSITVVIPDGTFSWSGTLTINHSLTLAGADAKGVTIQNHNANSNMIDATASANGHINIYWLNFIDMANNGSGVGFALSCDRSQPTNYTVLVHDCTFNNGTIYTYAVQCVDNGIIFWNDTFIGDGPNDPLALGGISFVCDKYGYTSSWNTPDTYGTQDTTGLSNSYVEDCKFYDAPTCISNFDDNSRVVWRYNTMQECSLGSHGQETSIYGARSWEIYNNTFIHPISGTGPSGNTYPMNMIDWFLARGGSGVIFNNQMDDIPWNKNGINLTVFNINRSDSVPCQTAYPAVRQTGQGWSASSTATFGNPVVVQDGKGAVTEGVYIWGNTGTETSDPNFVGLDQYAPDECGNGELITEFLKEGRDYFVGTAKPNYSPYQYPHPLHSAFAIGTTPKPTPTTPTPNPTPTPFSPSAWESNLYSEMESIGVKSVRIKKVQAWIRSHPLTSSGGSYSAWEKELYHKMHSIGMGKPKIADIEAWLESNAP